MPLAISSKFYATQALGKSLSSLIVVLYFRNPYNRQEKT